jgi:hypothetical protein
VAGESREPEVEDVLVLHLAEPVRVGVRTTQRDDAAVAQQSEPVILKHAPCRFARILVKDSLKLVHRSRFYRALIVTRARQVAPQERLDVVRVDDDRGKLVSASG